MSGMCGIWNRPRELGDFLAVAVNGDESVRALKGAGRPLNSEADRAEILAALEAVNFVTIFPSCVRREVIETAQPAIYVKGGDYTPESLDSEERCGRAKHRSKDRDSSARARQIDFGD